MARWLVGALLLGCARAEPRDLPPWRLELRDNPALRLAAPPHDCRFYRGRVAGEPDSAVALTECGQLMYGLVQVQGETFVIEPPKTNSAHIVQRREAKPPPIYNLTGDTVDDLFLEPMEPVYRPHVRVRHSHFEDDGVEYFREAATPVSRPASGGNGLWLELAIVADHSMVAFHGQERVKHYILALMNLVSAIFNEPSLDSNMTIVINKLFLYKEKDSVIKHDNVRKSLGEVNKWNYRHLTRLPKGNEGWDATVWLTREPLGGPSGYAPSGGVCSYARSAAIVHDEGLTSAFVIAHELGHLLGITHDDEGACELDGLHGSVMARTVVGTLLKYSWSPCSKKQFHEISKKYWCLQQRSHADGVELKGVEELPHYVFTMNEQCRTEFGEGFVDCNLTKTKSTCAQLWCADWRKPDVCHSKQAPPLEGTPCAPNHWCVNGICEPKPGHEVETEVESKAEWSEWESWSECSASCGYGIKTSIRYCQVKGSSKKQHTCEGASSQVATCWSGTACTGSRDIRASLCARQSSRFIPFIPSNDSKACEISCVDFEGGDPSNFGPLPDGSPCAYGTPHHVCHQGTCLKGTCNSSDSSCNLCPDGYCTNNTNLYTRLISKGWSRITVIPRGALLLSVHISTPLSINIAIRERKKYRYVLKLKNHNLNRTRVYEKQDKYLKYDPNVPQNLQIIEVDNNVIDIKEEERFVWEGRVVVAGTLMEWQQSDTDIYITAKSKLTSDIMIMAILDHAETPKRTEFTVEVSVNYSIAARPAEPIKYRCSIERGPCSVSCGGGVRSVRVRCARPQLPKYEACNTHSCDFTWAPGEWEHCSATCGDNGVQERQLFCVPANVSSISSRRDLIRMSVSPALCPTDQVPKKQQTCNQIPCPVYWRELPWTQCSATCGRGISRRPLHCPASDDFLCGPKPKERHRRCRLRRCPYSKRSCPAKDPSQYCELFTLEQLKRNCSVPEYRKYCCNACKKADATDEKGVG